jgi:carboxymethylenebutenolidase
MPVTSSDVHYKNQGDTINAYLSLPETGGPHPAVIVIPAVFGLNAYIKDITRRLASEGLAGLGLDFYSREGTPLDLSNRERIFAALASLPDERVVSDVLAAVDYLAGLPEIDGERIGTLGFCIGGTYSFMAACQTDRVKAAVEFYGQVRYKQLSENKPRSPMDYVPELNAPLLGHHGELDDLVPPEAVAEFKARLAENGKVNEIYSYPGCGHAFHEDYRPVYRPVAAHEAWQRTLVFFKWHLRAR